MLKKLTAALALMASPLTAQDFSEGSEARSWNLYAEMPAKFEATVVDLLCTFTGDCPAIVALANASWVCCAPSMTH